MYTGSEHVVYLIGHSSWTDCLSKLFHIACKASLMVVLSNVTSIAKEVLYLWIRPPYQHWDSNGELWVTLVILKTALGLIYINLPSKQFWDCGR